MIRLVMAAAEYKMLQRPSFFIVSLHERENLKSAEHIGFRFKFDIVAIDTGSRGTGANDQGIIAVSKADSQAASIDTVSSGVILNDVSDVASEADSHGIGLESVKSMMKQMGGICSVEKTDDTFQVTVLFRRDDMKW